MDGNSKSAVGDSEDDTDCPPGDTSRGDRRGGSPARISCGDFVVAVSMGATRGDRRCGSVLAAAAAVCTCGESILGDNTTGPGMALAMSKSALTWTTEASCGPKIFLRICA